ncbi:VOC family protein [Streptomyces sp. NPDC018610]|uniref:VOC family protein n=1 Tax=Streptomyces sp. NPDC018610 TaxID=3365049 RepID=UPI003792A1C1
MLTTRFVDGAPVWTDVGAFDLDGARAFYGGLFGWEFRPAGPGDGGYGLFRLDGRTVAGCAGLAAGQGPPSWTVYFRSADAGATARNAERAHGTVLVRPTDVTDQGRMAVLADRAGVAFGLWQPGRTGGVDLAGSPGALCWVELYTPDVPAAAAFYHLVLGLETSAASFPGGTYTCVNPAEGGADAMFGGVVPLADDPVEAAAGAYWLPYFAVEDADAAVARTGELGGTVRVPATDIPGVGRVARLADPAGARFAVLRPAPRREP